MLAAFAALALAAVPSLTATVTIDPRRPHLEAQVDLQVLPGGELFGLHENLRISELIVDGKPTPARRPTPGQVEVPAPSRVQLRYAGPLPTEGPDHADSDAVLLEHRRWPWLPYIGKFMDSRVTVRLPEGWQVVGSGDPPSTPPRCDAGICAHGPFVADRQPFVLLVASPRWIDARGGAVRVYVSPENEPSLSRLLMTTQAQLRALEARFGPRPTRAMTVVEAPVDGGYTVHGLVALNPAAVRRFADSDREHRLLVHELCHQWFGSIAAGHWWFTEGISRHCEIWWTRRTQGPEAAAAFEADLAAESLAARPGLSLRSADWRDLPWKDYEAVAYSRGALVHERLREAIGADAHDRFLNAHLAAHAGQMPSLDASLRLLDEVAPDFDRADFAARYLDRDVDPRTGDPRPFRPTLSARATAVIAGLLFLVAAWAGRRRPLVVALCGVALAGAAAALWRGPGWASALWPGLAVVVGLGARLARRRGRAGVADALSVLSVGAAGGGLGLVTGVGAAILTLAGAGNRSPDEGVPTKSAHE